MKTEKYEEYLNNEDIQNFLAKRNNLEIYNTNPMFHIILSRFISGGMDKEGTLTIIKSLCEINQTLQKELGIKGVTL